MPSRKTTRTRTSKKTTQRTRPVRRILDVRPDSLDFRDLLYVPTLVEVPSYIPLEDYRQHEVPILDQGYEGACTGFGLATVANYLLRRRKVEPDTTRVSPRMLYELAKRYDEWEGENYSGSSARGAMKGWHRHGVCSSAKWPYVATKPDSLLDDARARDAAKRPLGAYFRVNHKDLVAMHAAIAEVGILYATATVHEGWNDVGDDGRIRQSSTITGGHAFAIVAYDDRGFWIQNSWGKSWGAGGFGHVSYDDWLVNGMDVWVARLGVALSLATTGAQAVVQSAASRQSSAYAYQDLRPHIVSIGNDGALRTGGTYGTSEEDLRVIFESDFPRITKSWKTKRLLLYAHGGLVGEDTAIQRLADYREPLLEHEVYPVSFIWKTDLWTTIRNLLEDAQRRRRPEGVLDAAKDFLLDRADDALEALTRLLQGKRIWDEMKENARLATTAKNGGARLATAFVAALAKKGVEIHVIGHSAGSIFHAPLVRHLTHELKAEIETCTLWAPACTIDLFKKDYAPAIRSGAVKRFALYTLTDEAEQDDHCARIYNKSLLYLVSNACEERTRIPLFRPDGEPLLGMAAFVDDERKNDAKLWAKIDHVQAPNREPAGSIGSSTASAHGAFDDDRPTVLSTLSRILGGQPVSVAMEFQRSASRLSEKRKGWA